MTKPTQTEQRIRQILKKYTGDVATRIDCEEDFWQRFKFRHEEFCNEISSAFRIKLTDAVWEDVISISNLIEILEQGKLSTEKKIKNLNKEIKIFQQAIKDTNLYILPLMVLSALSDSKIGVIGSLLIYVFAVGINYMDIRSCKRKIKQLQGK